MNRNPDAKWMARAIWLWLLMIVAESLHGIGRKLLIEPWVGDLRARQIGVPVGSLIIFAIAWWGIGWIRTQSLLKQLGIGVLWVAATVGFEIALGRGVLGLSWDRILSDYDLRQGGWMTVGLVFMALTPWLGNTLRNHTARQSSDAFSSR